jgi:hypothetical protein
MQAIWAHYMLEVKENGLWIMITILKEGFLKKI